MHNRMNAAITEQTERKQTAHVVQTSPKNDENRMEAIVRNVKKEKEQTAHVAQTPPKNDENLPVMKWRAVHESS